MTHHTKDDENYLEQTH